MFVYFVSFTGGFPSPCYASRGMTSLFLSFPLEIPIATLRVSGNDVGCLATPSGEWCVLFFCFCVFLFCPAIQNLPYAVRQILHLHLFVRDVHFRGGNKNSVAVKKSSAKTCIYKYRCNTPQRRSGFLEQQLECFSHMQEMAARRGFLL